MFDVSFSELLVIAIVALIVIGPERLPKVARTCGVVIGRMKRQMASVKAEIDKELATDEIKKIVQMPQQMVAETSKEIEEVSKLFSFDEPQYVPPENEQAKTDAKPATDRQTETK